MNQLTERYYTIRRGLGRLQQERRPSTARFRSIRTRTRRAARARASRAHDRPSQRRSVDALRGASASRVHGESHQLPPAALATKIRVLARARQSCRPSLNSTARPSRCRSPKVDTLSKLHLLPSANRLPSRRQTAHRAHPANGHRRNLRRHAVARGFRRPFCAHRQHQANRRVDEAGLLTTTPAPIPGVIKVFPAAKPGI